MSGNAAVSSSVHGVGQSVDVYRESREANTLISLSRWERAGVRETGCGANAFMVRVARAAMTGYAENMLVEDCGMLKKVIIVLFAVVVFLAGCTIRMVDFTAISTKNVRIPTTEKGPRVTGEDCIVVVIFPFGIPNMKEAIDQAIEKAGPDYDALVDGVVYYVNQSFLFGRQCYKVEGTPINTKKSISLNDEQRRN
ncbi:MAG: hypothetical protein H6R26_2345, partial [Proteobacteria bacterium]|nr:hypothetical protein [Pseudomonadota bacterium]